MFNLQKPFAVNSITVFILVTIFFQTVYSQKAVADLPLFNHCWFYPTESANNIEIASDNDSFLYLSLSDGKLISIDSKTGEKYWETELIGNIISSPLTDPENIFIITNSSGSPNSRENLPDSSNTLHCLSKSTGIILWQHRLSTTGKVFLYNSENFITLINANGDAFSIAKNDGRLGWKTRLGTQISALPFKKKNEIILGTADQRVTILSLVSGKSIGSFEISMPAKVIIEDTTGSSLIIGNKKGILWSLNKKKKTRNWSFRFGAEISSLTLTAQGLLVSSLDNFVYLMSEKSGKIIWKSRLPGRIAAQPQLGNNYFIITSVDESEALVIELSSGRLVNKIVLGEENFFTGESTQTKSLFVYNTKKGILGFAQAGGCGKLVK